MRGDNASQAWWQASHAPAAPHMVASTQESGAAILGSLPGGYSVQYGSCGAQPAGVRSHLGSSRDPGGAQHSQQRHPAASVAAPSSLAISQRLGRLWHAPTLDTGACTLARQAATPASRPASLLELALLAETRPWQQQPQQQPQQSGQAHVLPSMHPHAQPQRWQQSQPQPQLQQYIPHAQVTQVQAQQQPQQSLLTAQQWRAPVPQLQQQQQQPPQYAADWQPAQHHRQLVAGSQYQGQLTHNHSSTPAGAQAPQQLQRLYMAYQQAHLQAQRRSATASSVLKPAATTDGVEAVLHGRPLGMRDDQQPADWTHRPTVQPGHSAACTGSSIPAASLTDAARHPDMAPACSSALAGPPGSQKGPASAAAEYPAGPQLPGHATAHGAANATGSYNGNTWRDSSGRDDAGQSLPWNTPSSSSIFGGAAMPSAMLLPPALRSALVLMLPAVQGHAWHQMRA